MLQVKDLISNFTECNIEGIEEVNPEDIDKCEILLWQIADKDEQNFINMMTVLSSFYGDVSSELINKWSR